MKDDALFVSTRGIKQQPGEGSMLVRLLGLFDGQLWLLFEVILHRIDEFVDIGPQFCLVSLHVLESGSGYFQQQLSF